MDMIDADKISQTILKENYHAVRQFGALVELHLKRAVQKDIPACSIFWSFSAFLEDYLIQLDNSSKLFLLDETTNTEN